MKPLSLAVFLFICAPASAADLPRAAPESQGVHSRFATGKVEADAAAVAKLNARMKSLAIRVPVEFTGKAKDVAGRIYSFPANDANLSSLGLETDSVTLTFGEKSSTIRLKRDMWVNGKAAWGQLPEQPAAAAGAWTAADTYTLKLCFVETPFIATIRMTFDDKSVNVESEMNVGFGATKAAPLTGTLK